MGFLFDAIIVSGIYQEAISTFSYTGIVFLVIQPQVKRYFSKWKTPNKWSFLCHDNPNSSPVDKITEILSFYMIKNTIATHRRPKTIYFRSPGRRGHASFQAKNGKPQIINVFSFYDNPNSSPVGEITQILSFHMICNTIASYRRPKTIYFRSPGRKANFQAKNGKPKTINVFLCYDNPNSSPVG